MVAGKDYITERDVPLLKEYVELLFSAGDFPVIGSRGANKEG
jgi:hypothetical protein